MAEPRLFWLRDWNRFAGAVGAGVLVGATVRLWEAAAGAPTGTSPWLSGALSGWLAFVLVHAVWVCLSVRGLDARRTRMHAQREDPVRAVREGLHVASALASVAGMGAMLLASGSDPVGRAVNAGLGLAAVLGAWVVVQLMYMLRYAAIYYRDAPAADASAAAEASRAAAEAGTEASGQADAASAVPPIDFNSRQEPTYVDFAYFAFTVGASFATSDASVCTTEMRRAVLSHSLLSFFFGSVVLASATSLMLQLVSVN